MPTYEFRCPTGHDFERFYKTISTAPSEIPCPECGLAASRRLSAGAGLVFKGSGFYLTDYGKNAHRGGAAEKSSDAKGESTASEAKKADATSKADAKSESSAPKADSPKADGRKADGPKADGPKAKPAPKPKTE